MPMINKDSAIRELLKPGFSVLDMGYLVKALTRKEAQGVCNALQAGRSRGNHRKNLVRRMARIYGNKDTPKIARLTGSNSNKRRNANETFHVHHTSYPQF